MYLCWFEFSIWIIVLQILKISVVCIYNSEYNFIRQYIIALKKQTYREPRTIQSPSPSQNG